MLDIKDKDVTIITEEDKVIEKWRKHFRNITCNKIKKQNRKKEEEAKDKH